MKSLIMKDLSRNEELDRKAMAAVCGGYVNKAWNSWYGDDVSSQTGTGLATLARNPLTIVT